MLPFTRDQFFALFGDYNAGVWPAQIVAYLVGLAIVVALMRPSRLGDRVIAAGWAAMWVWTGVVYHGLYFSTINKAALVFAALFVLQGLAIFFTGVVGGSLRFEPKGGRARWLGWLSIGYAAIVYPLIGLGTGHRLGELPMFGITPCPVTIFSWGLLLLATRRVPWWLLVIPFAWSLIGGSAAFLLGVPQDWALLVSGLLAAPMLLRGPARQSVAMPA